MPPRKYVTTREELDAINNRISTVLRLAIRKADVSFSEVASWASVSDDTVRNWIRDDEKAQKIPLGKALLLIRRGHGPVRTLLAECIQEIIEKPEAQVAE